MSDTSKQAGRKLLSALFGLVVLVVIVSTTYMNNQLILFVLIIGTVAIFGRPTAKKADWLPFLIGAFFGPLAEIIIIHAGAWHYTNPTVAGIPIWLPILWGLTSLFLTKISFWLDSARSTK